MTPMPTPLTAIGIEVRGETWKVWGYDQPSRMYDLVRVKGPWVVGVRITEEAMMDIVVMAPSPNLDPNGIDSMEWCDALAETD